MTTVIATSSINNPFETSRRDINKAIEVLNKQGMIEPLIVQNEMDEITNINIHHPAFLEAAKELNWPTVLVISIQELDLAEGHFSTKYKD